MPDQELKTGISEYSKLWISRIFRTKPIVPENIVPAIQRLYEVSGLKEPRIVIVPSPVVAVLAGGLAASIWHFRKQGSRHESVFENPGCCASLTARPNFDELPKWATSFSCAEKVNEALEPIVATCRPISEFLGEAIDTASWHFSRGKSHSSAIARRLSKMTASATGAAYDSIQLLCAAEVGFAQPGFHKSGDFEDFIQLVHNVAGAVGAATSNDNTVSNRPYKDLDESDIRFILWWAFRHWKGLYQGGFGVENPYEWIVSAARAVCGVSVPIQDGYAAWEECRIHGGPRMAHDKFCIVSDFPELMNVDSENRLHSETGPSIRWRDGWEFYHRHGVSIPYGQ